MSRIPIRLIAAAAAAAILLPSCATDGGGDPSVVTTWFHAGQGGEREVLDEQVRRFNTGHTDVQVALELLPEGEYDSRVQAAAEDGELPCLLDFDGPFLTNYAEQGLLQPLDGLLDDAVTGDLLPSLREQGTYEDRLYGMGTFDAGLALWGRRSLLEDAGVRVPTTVADAWTFEEFNDALERLQALPDVDHAIEFKLNYGVGEWFTFGLSPIVWGFGGSLYDPDPDADALTSAASVQALTWWQGLLDRGIAPREQEADDLFYGTGEAALSWVGHWMWETHRDALGEDLVLLPMPRMPADHVTGLGSWQWGIPTTCDAPAAAATVLEFLLSTDEILAMTAANGAVPARTAAIEASPLYGPDGPLRIFAEQLDAGLGRPRPVTPHYPVVTAAFAEAVDRIRDGAPVADALADAEARIDAAATS